MAWTRRPDGKWEDDDGNVADSPPRYPDRETIAASVGEPPLPKPAEQAAGNPPRGETFLASDTGPTPILPPAPDAQPMVRKEWDRTSTKEIVTKEEKDLREKRRGEQEKAIDAVKEEKPLDRADAEIKTLKAEREKDAETQHQGIASAINQDLDAKIAASDADIKARIERHANTKPESFWRDKTTGDKVLAWIAIALGGLGSALKKGGGENKALGMISKAIDDDYNRQLKAIDKQKDEIDYAKGKKLDLRQEKADKHRDNDTWRAGAFRQAALEAEAELARNGVPRADIQNNRMVAELRAKALEADERALASEREKVVKHNSGVSVTGGPGSGGARGGHLTEGQAKAADLAGRMTLDHEILEKNAPVSQEGLARLRQYAANEAYFKANPGKKAAAIKSGEYKTPEQFLNDADRLVYAAGRRFGSAVLRGDSGALISVEDYLDFSEGNLPQPGDKDRDMAIKGQARRAQLEGKLRAAGPAAGSILQGAASRPPLPAAPQPGTRIQVRDKKTGAMLWVRKMPDGRLLEDDEGTAVAAR